MSAAKMKKMIIMTAAAIASGAALLAVPGLVASAPAEGEAIQPFKVAIPDKDLVELRRRIAATRWPTRELVEDRSQGVQLGTLQKLANYWTTEYDWRKAEARLNALPQFTTEIDGVTIHFIHVRSKHENALPLIMTHGWPGSVIELLETVGPLTDPTVHGGTAEDAFHLVLPSLPGYGFSSEPAELGWDSGRIALAWAELMKRLGYTRYVAQGGDVGALVTDVMGRQAPAGLAGIHLSLLAGAPFIVDRLPKESEQERAAHAALATFMTDGFGYFQEQVTRPQTIGYSLLDSPVRSGDVGALVTDVMGRQAPAGLAGIHLSLLAGAPFIVDRLPKESEQERAAHAALATFMTDGFGYFQEQVTRPQTIGYSLLDSPVGLAAWMLDH